MYFDDYISLLNAIKDAGEVISPASVSVNRSYGTKELSNVQLELKEFKPFLVGKKELKYIKQEIDWFLDRDYKPTEYFVNRDGPNSNYGAMCLKHQNYAGYTQIQWCEDKLKADKNTRQAVTFYNSPEYQYKGNIDFVCTLTQMFSIKNDHLNTTVNIRSSDILNGFRYDMIWYRVYQTLLCDRLKFSYPDLDLGSMTFNIFSAHYYLRDEELLERVFKRAEKDKFEKLAINDLI